MRTKEQIEEYRKAWYQRNKARISSMAKARYFEANKEKILKRRELALSKQERVRDYLHRWHQQNKERRAVRAKELSADPIRKKRRVIATLKCRSKNPQKYRAYMSAYQKRNRAKMNAHAAKRRALEKAATINLRSIEAWMAQVKARRFSKCYYCGERVRPNEIHFDHIVPISKGGAHAVENLCVSCAPCNQHKSASLITVLFRSGQQILSL
jgi:5-methylcytosine-specific restriction endonuclease McrA